MNAVVTPALMDIRVRTRDTGFWFFREVAYSLQIQTAAASYDAITGSRLALGILTDEVDIDENEAGIIRNGQEVAGRRSGRDRRGDGRSTGRADGPGH